MTCQRSSDWEWNCKSAECLFMAAEKIKSLPLCTGLLNEQLPRASHPSWVLGTQKGIYLPTLHLGAGSTCMPANRLDYREHSPVGAIIGTSKRWWGPGKGIILCLLWPPHQRLSHSLSPGGQLPVVAYPSPFSPKLGTNTKYLFYSPWATLDWEVI